MFFGPSLDHIEQNKPSYLHYRLFFSFQTLVHSEKKNRVKKKIDLTYLPYFKFKKKEIKIKKKIDLPTLFEIFIK